MYNGHGDVTNLLDGKGGIIGSYYYDAFGNVQENTSTFSNPYRYAGYQYDEEIGKYYLLNRMYDPESARFMQEDTYRGNANDPLSLNLYTYVNNNPMIYDDQNGHWPSFIDNFVSAASNTWNAIKETASYVGSKISSALSSGVSYLANTSVGKAVTSTINKGKKIYNTVTGISKAASIVYNKVIKPQVERDDREKLQELKTGIAVKAGDVVNYVKGLDLNKLLYGDMPVVAETNVKYDYSPRTGGTIGDKVFNFWTSSTPFKVLNGLSEFQEKYPQSMIVAGAFMLFEGIKNPSAAEKTVELRSESTIEKDLNKAIKGAAEASELAKPGEDLYVGTYSKSRYANIKSGLNETHTPHHAVQDAISETTHGKGITINIRKDLHELTGTFRKTRDIDPTDLRTNLAADVSELRNILKDAGYDRNTINRQLQELIRQNKATGDFLK